MLVFDTLYSDIDNHTKQLVMKIFEEGREVRMENGPRQEGIKDCGIFAIAICTSLAYSQLPSSIAFKQSVMRSHLVHCYENICV